MESLHSFIVNFLDLSAEASPWLLLGLLIAGLMKAWLPSKVLGNHLGEGKSAIIKAALIGAPLPLCSCGVIPVATELKRSGASSAATSSFLVATPETGVDSVSVSYALLGPFFAIYRPIAAILSAIFTGALVSSIPDSKILTTSHDKTESSKSCCADKAAKKIEQPTEATKTSCCSSTKHDSSTSKKSSTHPMISKTKQGVSYAATQLIDDIIVWLLIGLTFAATVRTFLPQEFLLSYGSGLPAMLLMIVISIPMYICATASTPIAAGFILAGLSPGTALVFMMAGPATNISTLGVIKKEMGTAVLTRYLTGVAISAIAFGLILDNVIQILDMNITEQMQHSHEILPHWFGLACALLITLLAIKPLRRLMLKA